MGIALVMATAAGISSVEKRWVKFSEVSKDMCQLSSELPFDLEECELAMEEDSGGGVDLKRLVKMITKRVASKRELPIPINDYNLKMCYLYSTFDGSYIYGSWCLQTASIKHVQAAKK